MLHALYLLEADEVVRLDSLVRAEVDHTTRIGSKRCGA